MEGASLVAEKEKNEKKDELTARSNFGERDTWQWKQDEELCLLLGRITWTDL